MKIMMTGGGSGGHITPVLNVADELKRLKPDAEIIYVGQRGDSLGDIPAQHPAIDRVVMVRAGKLRRYHGEGLKQLLDLKTMGKNIRDVVYLIVGLFQAFFLLRRLKPDVIFTRGSFVSVPVAWAAALLRIPYITHDSDAIPSLTNRLIARWATQHAVALPKEIYHYPPGKTITVGVPISKDFKPTRPADMQAARKHLGLGDYKRLLLVTGGGNGAERLNSAVAACLPELLMRYKDLAVVHIAGRSLEAPLRQRYKTDLNKRDQARVIVKGFISDLWRYSAAANVIITRAGGTSIAEFAVQGKACIVVPNPQLTGGHQPKNAEAWAARKAVRLVTEERLREDDHALMPALTTLLDDPAKATDLGAKLATFARPNATNALAVLLLDIATAKKHAKNTHVQPQKPASTV